MKENIDMKCSAKVCHKYPDSFIPTKLCMSILVKKGTPQGQCVIKHVMAKKKNNAHR
jgi:hypothetical protein